jgi:predicted  nucleic acid-binding Zn-ribbon protein
LEVLGWCVVAGLVAGIAVYSLQERRRLVLAGYLQALRTSAAVAEARVQTFERERDEQGRLLNHSREESRALSIERERLTTQLEQLELQISQSTAALTATGGDLRTSEAERLRVGADLQVATATLEGTAFRERTLQSDLDAAKKERQGLHQQVTELSANHAAVQKECAELRLRLEEQKTWLAEQTTHFEQGVLAAAAKVMDERGKAFTETNKKEVDAVVGPFKDQLAEFRLRVDAIYAADTSERGQLREQIVQLTSLNQTTSAETKRLINALTISSKATGDWGETILERILEDSGLRLGKEYELQYLMKNSEGERLQPDAVLFLPEGRQLVVDAKVSNKAWTAYCGESDEAPKAERLRDHLASLRAHVKGVERRFMQKSATSVDNSWIEAHVVGEQLGFATDGKFAEAQDLPRQIGAQMLRVADIERITLALQVLNDPGLVGDRLQNYGVRH